MQENYMRTGRKPGETRNITIIPNVSRHAEGSCLIKVGNTHVFCTASIETKVPAFLKGKQSGWVTAEYGMLPRATNTRTDREATKGKQTGRTSEIQRLIARSLRACIDLDSVGENQIKIDCDVLQADGGTRTAAISGGYVAMAIAIKKSPCLSRRNPLIEQVAAISCGVIKDEILLDLDYEEDRHACVDGNFVFTALGQIVEVQMTGERNTFGIAALSEMTHLALKGCAELFIKQKACIESA